SGGWVGERRGTGLEVDGPLVLVDAACSGVQVAWMAYFCAGSVAVISGVGDRRWLRRLPWVGVVVLAGSVVRNSVLVALQARGAVSEPLHQAIGLVVLAGVCAAVVMAA